ncbi:MAG: YbjN domain-containing protein [Firmicutes bacterium]|nr:YbjN domain-containing protein [Bacillota bacterium]
MFYSVCPVNVPEGKRLAVAEYLTRANYGLVIGNFEMDFRDGEVRYKTSIDVEGAEIAPALVRNLVYANVITMDRYLPGLLGVIYGNLTPEQAIAQVEG